MMGSSADAPPVALSTLARLPRQRRRGVLALGLLTILAGGMFAYVVGIRLGGRTPVVITTRDLTVGQQITATDVAVVRVGVADRMATIPGARMDRVVGAFAAVDLRSGELVPPSGVTSQLMPPAGHALVPLAIKPSQLPAGGLHPGAPVVVVTAPSSTGTGQATSGGPSQFSATIAKVATTPDSNGLDVVDVLVAASDGPALAFQAATGQVEFVLTSRSH